MGGDTMHLATDKPPAIAAGSKNVSAQRRPDFFIVGAPRCGTTALAQFLSAHPGIYMARKEMHFFGADLRFGPQFYRRDLKAYLAEFEAWAGQTRAGEASVWYLFSEQAAAEIKVFNPDARIIILLREPVAMLYSLYNQFRADGNEHLPTFKEALAAEDDRRAGRCLARQAYFPQGLVYRATARYTDQVRRYYDTFGRERVQVILYDDFAADTAGVYRKTLNFLGVADDGPTVNFGVINSNKSVRSAAVRDFLNDPLLRGTIIAARSRMPRSIFATAQRFGALLNNCNTRVEKRPPLPRDLKLLLRREFSSEVEQLSMLLGRNLAHWNETEPPLSDSDSGPAAALKESASLNVA